MAYIIRGLGYVKNKEDLENIAVGNNNGIPVRVKDIGSVQMGGDLRLGIFDENGEGEVVGGIVVMRYGENASKVIENVKKKMADVQRGLPEGVKFKVAYDRTELIKASVSNVKNKLIEEMIVVSLIVILFLLHWRSALSIIIQIPITIALSFILLNAFGLSSNIMSLTGIALAIGVIVDNGIIMSENAYRHLSERQNNPPINHDQMNLFKKTRTYIKIPGGGKNGHHRKGLQTGQPGRFLFHGHHHLFLSAGLFIERPGGKTFPSAGLYQDFHFNC